MTGVQITKVPNTLAAKIGPRARVFTAKLLRAAERALTKVCTMYGFWLQDNANKLEVALHHGEPHFAKYDVVPLHGLIRQLQSSANAFAYPVMSRLAASLDQLFEGADGIRQPPTSLISSHLLAIKAAARAPRGLDDDPIAVATCVELEALTRAYLRND